MPEGRRIVSLEVTKFLQEPRNLYYDPENIFRSRVIMHLESLYCLVVLYNRVKALLFQFLPVAA